ncbi:HVO_A0114 family putative DNA-binding protein [Ferrimonas marina]|uniref:Predicted transcriptional regulator n=1 Tax=Ferrimonas marina TaxID=299255 RepID=A0A1M5TU83_9GAMM|nr:MarR family transcriptional regulator [Ferrimonas marina]SHH54347.1 Predicted transcriptional regulator [Ferrimonas marina]
MTTARIGVMPEHMIRRRMLAIAKGAYIPEPGEPKVWYASMKAASAVFSEENMNLLRIIDEKKPETVSELAELTGRAKSNLSVTLKNLEQKSLIRMVAGKGKAKKPVAMFTDVEIVISLAFERRFEALQVA